jgi:hypothetical protein
MSRITFHEFAAMKEEKLLGQKFEGCVFLGEHADGMRIVARATVPMLHYMLLNTIGGEIREADNKQLLEADVKCLESILATARQRLADLERAA